MYIVGVIGIKFSGIDARFVSPIFNTRSDSPLMNISFQLLIGISCAIPFVGVRTLYSLIGSLKSFTSNFSPISGSLTLYVAMSVVMEFIAVFIYVVVGISIPLDLDRDELVGEQTLPLRTVVGGGGQQYAPVYPVR